MKYRKMIHRSIEKNSKIRLPTDKWARKNLIIAIYQDPENCWPRLQPTISWSRDGDVVDADRRGGPLLKRTLRKGTAATRTALFHAFSSRPAVEGGVRRRRWDTSGMCVR